MDPFLGEIRPVPYNFAPFGWAFCDGTLLSISQHTALFALLGTTYGGNGQTTFALPDLRGRVPLHAGQGPGLQPYVLGEEAGTETVTLSQLEIPLHTHLVSASSSAGSTQSPLDSVPAKPNMPVYGAATNMFAADMVQANGSGLPHENRQPYLTITYIIALQGIFPSRN